MTPYLQARTSGDLIVLPLITLDQAGNPQVFSLASSTGYAIVGKNPQNQTAFVAYSTGASNVGTGSVTLTGSAFVNGQQVTFPSTGFVATALTGLTVLPAETGVASFPVFGNWLLGGVILWNDGTVSQTSLQPITIGNSPL